MNDDSSIAKANDGDHAVHLRDAIEALPEAIAVFDEKDRFVLWNRRFEEVYGGVGLNLHIGLDFAEHLRRSVALGKVPAAIGREEQWLRERLARFHAAHGAHDHQLSDGRWVRVQDRKLAHGGRVGIRADITELADREQSFRLLFNANPTPLFLLNLNSRKMVAVNDAALDLYGYSREAFLQLSLPDIWPEWHSGDIDAPTDDLPRLEAESAPRFHRTASGEERIVRVNETVTLYAGQPTVLAAIFDLTELLQMADEVRRSRSFLQKVLDHIPTAVSVKDMGDGGRYVLRNKASEGVYGRPSAQVLGKADIEFLDREHAGRIACSDRETMQSGSSGTVYDETVRRPDGALRLIRTRKISFSDDEASPPRYVLGIAEDVTEQRASEARIAFMAHHDALTELPNRYLFQDRLQSALARLQGTDQLLALLLIDLDGFKSINDTWGHAAGDELLRLVAERINACLRPTDTGARLGGDEFALLLAPIEQVGEAVWLATRMTGQLSSPFWVGGHRLEIGASIGISIASAARCDAEIVTSAADAALYDAKRHGKNRFSFAEGALNIRAEDTRSKGTA